MLDADRLSGRIEDVGISQAELGRRVGLSQQAVGKLVHGKTRETPKLYQIARELRTTPAYLVGKIDDPDEGADTSERLSSDEVEWVALYASLTPEQRKAIRALVRSFVEDTAPSGTHMHDRRQESGTVDLG